jgi:ech hydrogenase subunit A
MNLIIGLVLLPLLVGLLLLVVRADLLRRVIVTAAVLGAVVASVVLAIVNIPEDLPLPVSAHAVSYGMLAVEALMTLFVVYVGIRWKRPLIALLMLAQAVLMGWVEFGGSPSHAAAATPEHAAIARDLFVDKFSVILAFINGVVGGGICLYALGYMKEYHEHAHKEVTDRRPTFFALLFVFMGAMFGISFSNNLLWLYFFWEVTTLCSFLLIGYTRTEEARNNALRALVMNLAGGLGFAGAIGWMHYHGQTLELQALLHSGKGLALMPAALLCFAGITKSAQLPFSNWLLGAMVAPTPVSALLHSSTMVKAGVYLIIRMASVIHDTHVGFMVALVGAMTFIIGSFAAITASDAKRLLAWSTVANLGLIGVCGGIGTDAAVWAGVLLIIFHAVAKCLMFLCVGVVEHKLHNRSIDNMTGLVLRMPRVAVSMLIGMAGMFLAPFGMLVSKWAVLKAVVDAYPVLSIFIAFGSSATLFFWVKWMGTLVQASGNPVRIKKEFDWTEGVALFNLSGGVFMCCALFPIISHQYIEPYVMGIYPNSTSIGLGSGNILLMSCMMTLVLLFPMSFLNYGRGVKVVDAYLAGANVETTGGSVKFVGSGGAVTAVETNNYYLRGMFSEVWLARAGIVSCALFLALMMWMAYK